MAFSLTAGAVLEGARSGSLTYPQVGATAGDELPAGYRHLSRRWVIGGGAQTFHHVTTNLLTWRMHRAAGLGVCATAPVAARDVVVALSIGMAPLRVFAPCRVVYEVSEARRRGFAYGTLRGHPECGEEAFVVAHQRDDAVVLEILAFSRPATRSARLAGPLNKLLQDRITERYATALRGAARSA